MENIEGNEKTGKLIVVSGPSGSGKSTVLAELRKLGNYKFSISATTRAPREGEIEGIDYCFMSKEDFLKKAADGDILEYVEYSGNLYGTPRVPLEKMLGEGHDVILEIEVLGAWNIKQKFPGAVMIFLLPPSYAETERRLRARGTESEENVKTRLETAKKEIESLPNYDYLVTNESDMQKKAAFDINCIAEAEKNKMNRENSERFLKKFFGQNI